MVNENGRDHEVIVDKMSVLPLVISLAVSLIFTVVAYAMESRYGIEDIGNITVAICILYIVMGFQTVKQEEIGLIRLFGEGVYRVDAGLVFVPPFVMYLDRESRLDRQDKFPATEDKIFYGDIEKAGGTLPPGMVLPIRQLFGPPKEGEVVSQAYKPYDKQMVASVRFAANWYIWDLKKFRNTIGTTENLREQIRAIAVGVFATQFSQSTPAIIMGRLDEESRKLEKELDRRSEAWGVDFISTPIEPFDFSHDLNKSVTRTSEAEQEALQTEIAARAEATKIERVGTATANAKRANIAVDINAERDRLKARAEGLRALKEVVSDPVGLSALELETVRSGLDNNPNITIITGQEGLTHTVASLGKVFRGNKEKKNEKSVE